MFGLFLGATLFAGSAGLLLFGVLLRRIKVERYFVALALALLFFEIFNATAFAAILFLHSPWQSFFAQSLGYLFVLTLPLGIWAAQPLIIASRTRTLLKLVMLGLGLAFGAMHAKSGLLQIWGTPEIGFMLVLTNHGKLFFAASIVGLVLLLSKFEPFAQALAWRAGKRSGLINGTFFLFMLSLIMCCSVSLIYSRVDHVLWLASQLSFGLLCLLLFFALRSAQPQLPATSLPTIRVSRLLSSSVLIYAGAYCLAFGVLVKLALALGGSWHLFVSFFAALGAVVLALVLLTENSLHQRWTRFVDRHWRAESYDFRHELHRLTEKIAAATDQNELVRAFGAGLQEIFASTHCCLWVKEENAACFTAFQFDEKLETQTEPFALSAKQIAWLERIEECFSPKQFLALEEQPATNTALLQSCACMTALHVGRNVIGLLGLGPKRNGETYREEDRQLLDLLANAVSLALHEAYLRQRVLAAKQSESIYRIAAFIAHDLRHAVGSLTLLAHNAKAHLDKPEFRADFLASLSRVSQEMHTLMQRLSAVNTGGESTQFAECDATQLINEIVADAQIAPPIVLEMKLEPLPLVRWDKEQIRVVLRNLLVNAREAMPNGGTLSIHARSDDSHVRIVVCDEGVGMSPEFMQHRLFRPNQTTKTKGLGIGLYQSREIVHAHRGEIYVQSEIGKETRFEVVLPCSPGLISQH